MYCCEDVKTSTGYEVDIPAVGIETIKRAVEIGAKGIVGEAGRMLFLNRDEAIRLAEENSLFILGIKV